MKIFSHCDLKNCPTATTSKASLARKLMLVGCCCLAALIILVKPTPAWAGADINGVNWCGVWDATWGSSTGSYNSPMTVQCSGQVGSATGTYNNGTLNGETFFIYNGLGELTAVKFKGQWNRTQGNSGGQCPYGQFSLDLVADQNRDASGFPYSKFFGNWTYCNDDPDGLTQRWAWYGYERR